MRIDWKSFREKKTLSDKGAFPTGTRVYTAHIGGGKTLSMTHDILELKKQWPKMEVWANYEIKGLPGFHLIENEKMMDDALAASNGADGIVVAIDEAHLFWEKKNGIPLEVLEAISYQRKDRKKIMMTTQVWESLPVDSRKQVAEIVSCNRFMNIQFNTVMDGHTLEYDKKRSKYIAKTTEHYVFKHNDSLYEAFNTYQKAIKNKDILQKSQIDYERLTDRLL